MKWDTASPNKTAQAFLTASKNAEDGAARHEHAIPESLKKWPATVPVRWTLSFP